MFFPHASETVWTLAEDRSVYVVEQSGRAGNSVMTIFLDDLDAPSPRSLAAGSSPTSA